MKKIITIINGKRRVGKDTFIKNLERIAKDAGGKSKVINYSTIDFYKEISKSFGWDGVSKSPADRELWRALKKISVEYNDLPVKKLFQDIRNSIQVIRFYNTFTETKLTYLHIFIHCREISEIQKIKKILDPVFEHGEGFTWGENLKINTLLLSDSKQTLKQRFFEKDFRPSNYDYHYIVETLDDISFSAEKYFFETGGLL